MDGIGDACQDFTGVPETMNTSRYRLFSNFPNPFTDLTTIRYTIPRDSRVIMKIYDLTGKEVSTLVDREMPGGSYEVTWDSREFSDGIYVCSFYAQSTGSNDVVWKSIRMILSR